MIYYPTFFIHQTVRTADFTYMWVQFKLNDLVFNCKKNGWMGGISFFTVCDLSETFIFMSEFSMEASPQMNCYLVVKRKEGHILSYNVRKRSKVLKKTDFLYSKGHVVMFLKELENQTSHFGAFF